MAGLLLVLCLFASASAAAREEILAFDSRVEVLADASITVTETIRVRSENREIRRGIYRDFPTDYRDRFGNRYRVGFDVLDVWRDGAPETYRTEPHENGARVWIGSKDRFLDPGVYTYTLTYRTSRQLGFFADHDELYWNVTGNGWSFPILAASASVRLPGVRGVEAGFEAYTGPSGEQGHDYRARVDVDGVVRFETTRALAPREGFTLVVTWPKGFVTEPGSVENAVYLLRDNAPLWVGVLGIAALVVFYLVTWHRYGRDPEPGIIVPLYEPPSGYSPASMRFIRRMGYDHKTFAAALINLAVKGLVDVEEEDGDYLMLRTGKPATGLSPGEKALLGALFVSLRPGAQKNAGLDEVLAELESAPGKLRLVPKLLGQLARQRLLSSSSSDATNAIDPGKKAPADAWLVLERKNHARIRAALRAHEAALARDYDKIYFRTNSGWMVAGIGLTVLTLAGSALGLAGEAKLIALFLSLWLSFWSIGVVALLRQSLAAWRGADSVLEWTRALFATLFALPFIIGEIAGLGFLAVGGSPIVAVLLVIAVAINGGFYYLLKAPTRAGRELLDKAEGFRLFLDVAEKDEMNLRNPPEKTPELFERYLPFALAMDVENRWAEKFSSLFARLDEEGRPYRPVWYRGRHFSPSNMGAFSSAIGGSLGSAIAGASTAPGSSSGAGGGGSSGGGGGGGGGGGW